MLAARLPAHFFFPAMATAFPFLVRALFFVVCPLTGSCCKRKQSLSNPISEQSEVVHPEAFRRVPPSPGPHSTPVLLTQVI